MKLLTIVGARPQFIKAAAFSNKLKSFPDICLEQFEMKELMYNVTHHRMVPPHRLISKREMTELKKRLSCSSLSVLNKIQTSDPISRYFNAKPGQVFEILRSSPEGHQYKAYRLVR